jgi:F-type H+-transporting ATPase subunit gamma
MDEVIANLAAAMAGASDAPRLLAGTGGDKTHLLVVCTAERGLCGPFNSSIARLARDHAARLLADDKDVKILCVGRKGYNILRRLHPQRIVELVDLRAVRQIGFDDAQAIGRKVLELFDTGEFDICTLFYARFRSVISQIPTAKQLIPVEVGEPTGEVAARAAGAIYEYEPDEESILAELLPRNVSVQIFRALLENAASEMGAKMSAMDSATRNAGDMIDRLTLNYNRTRQAMITKELIEIISGAEAM